MISGSITDAYATGAVSGNSDVGGLVGLGGGTITAGYYDASTTGGATGSQSNGSVGLTTAALQGTLPSGFSSSVWSTGAGLYPYLTNFFPHGAQAVSGFAYSDGGATPLASGAGGAIYVGAMANGVTLGTATTGANGYYYILTAAGGVPGSSVLAYATTPRRWRPPPARPTRASTSTATRSREPPAPPPIRRRSAASPRR